MKGGRRLRSVALLYKQKKPFIERGATIRIQGDVTIKEKSTVAIAET
jgi:hypothetical protein